MRKKDEGPRPGDIRRRQERGVEPGPKPKAHQSKDAPEPTRRKKKKKSRILPTAIVVLAGLGGLFFFAANNTEERAAAPETSEVRVLEQEEEIQLAWKEEAGETPSGLIPASRFRAHMERLKQLEESGDLVWLEFTIHSGKTALGESYSVDTSLAYKPHQYTVGERQVFRMPAHRNDVHFDFSTNVDNEDLGMRGKWYTPIGTDPYEMQARQKRDVKYK